MITLADPPSVKSVLGGSATVDYDHFILSQIIYDPVLKVINGACRLTSTAEPTMTPIYGTYKIAGSVLEISVEQLDFYRRVTLSPEQVAVYQQWISDAQVNVETGLLGLVVVQGQHAAGV